MSQSIFTSINPNTTSGNQLATLLNNFKDAYVSSNSGTSRPSALQAGGTWLDTTSPTSWILKMYDGTDDISLFTIDLAANVASITTTSSLFTIVKSSDDALGAVLKFFKERPTGNQTETGDTIGKVDFYGNRDDDVEALQASIEVVSSDDVTSTAQGAYILFKGTTDGAASVAEWMRLVDGKLAIGTTTADETLHVKGTGIKAEKASDDAVGVKVVRKKKRVTGVGQVQASDVIATESYVSTDEAGANVDIVQVEVSATETTSTTAQGSRWKLKTKNNGATSFTDQITADSSGVDIPNLKVGTVSNTEISYLDGVTSNIQTQINGKISTTSRGAANGVAPLESDGKIDSAYLPSYVDDVLEYANTAAFPVTGSAGIIYVALDTNEIYRWGGSSYVNISKSAVDALLTSTAFTLSSARHFTSNAATDSTTTGSDASLAAFTAGLVRLTNASLTSLANIPAGDNGQFLIIVNRTGADISVKDQADALGTAANRIYTGTGTTATLKNNGSFFLIYDSTTARWQLVGGTGSGSGQGGINYITNYDAEAGTTGWATYLDAAGTSPVDGTGGSPNITWTRTTSTPLRGTGSFLLTKDAFSRQGEGVSYAFTIDNSDKGKVLQCSFEYQIASGTFADTPDITLWIFDVTNSRLIQPAPYQLKNSGIIEKFGFEFQSSSDSTSYRLIIHISSTSTSAYTIKFDNFNLGPQAKLYGSPITDWISFTPTGSWVSNTTYSGRWRRVGDKAEIQYSLQITGGVTAASLTVSIPSGLSIDSSKLIGGLDAPVGFGSFLDAGNYYGIATPFYNTSTTLLVRGGAVSGTQSLLAQVTQTTPQTWASGDSITFTAELPIVGWGSSQIQSSDADTRIIAAIYNGAPTGTLSGSFSTIAYPTKIQDTHGAYNTSTGLYTVYTPGFYRIEATAVVLGTITAGTSEFNLGVSINGATPIHSNVSYADNTLAIECSMSKLVYVTAGQTISVQANTTVTSPTLTATSRNYFSVCRMSGPAQIAASETVAMLYRGAPPTGSITDASILTNLVFGTKVKDSHNAYNTTTGYFTVPVSGVYDISAQFGFTGTFATNTEFNIYLSVNGSNAYGKESRAGGAIVGAQPSFDIKALPLLAGQTLAIRGYTNATSPTLISSPAFNFISIVRSGNY